MTAPNPKQLIKSEPVVSIATIAAVFNALQAIAIPGPTWIHTAILVLSAVFGTLASRQLVTPRKAAAK